MAAGDSIADIETDKATMTWEAQDDGFVAKILVEAGVQDVQVGAPVAIFVEEQVSACSPVCICSNAHTAVYLGRLVAADMAPSCMPVSAEHPDSKRASCNPHGTWARMLPSS